MDAESVASEEADLCNDLGFPEINMQVRQHRKFDNLHNGALRPLYLIRVFCLFIIFETVAFFCIEKTYLNAEIWHVPEHLSVFGIGQAKVHGYE